MDRSGLDPRSTIVATRRISASPSRGLRATASSLRLREDAEAELAKTLQDGLSSWSHQEVVHELRVHQVELQMQNEELLRTQDALHESEQKYRLLSDLASDCIIWTEPNGQIRYISPACQSLFGYTADRFVADPGLLLKLIVELQAFNKLMVGRELAMVELKKEINALSRELSREPPYPVGLPSRT